MVIVAACAAALFTVNTNSANAQQGRAVQPNGTPAVQASNTMKKIGFRLIEWKAIHSHSEQESKETVAALQKVGCEVLTEQHGDHIDVKYRCPEWKALSLANNQLVNQWSTWFQAKGIETVVVSPPANTQKPTVKFRLTTPKTVHLHDQEAAKKIINTLKLVGCQVQTNEHNGHLDATFSSPNWITIELPSEDNAHAWQKWFDDSGFETQHEHK